MIDLTKVPPFADAAWANEPNAPCLWCAGTGHVNGDYADGEICRCPDITNNIDRPYHPEALCKCGDAECLGPADAVIPVVEALAATLPQLQSPMLKLIKERNEARRLCELLAGSFPDIATLTNKKAIDAANAEMHQALWTYCKAKKGWDKRSYQLGGAE